MFSIVIPAYNEQDGITSVVSGLNALLPQLNIPFEVIVVDDGSQDKTAEYAVAAGASVVRHPCNIGYGNALKTGILAAKYPHIGITDADGTYPVEDIPRLYQTFGKGYDMVVGARTGGYYQESLLKNPARILFNLLAEYVAGTHIPDVNSGLRIFKKECIKPFLPDLCGTFSFTTSMTLIAFRQSYFICYIPVPYYQRQGRSKVKIFRDTLRAAQILVQTILTYNPLKLFLLVAMINFCFALVCGLLYMACYRVWEVFMLMLFFGGVASISILTGFVAVVANQRVRHVRDIRLT
jgi:polyisoprenyl-phosphate glycosyltransferase